jgi:signal transduction histidine kinase
VEGDERTRSWDAQKFEALGRLAVAVAHDFNNLLLVIRGYACLLAETLPAGTRDAERAEEIGRTVDRAGRLAQQLLEFGRARPGRALLDVDAALGGLGELLQRLVGPRIEVRVERPGRPVDVRLDCGRLEQIVVNLAVNARDAMADGGRLTVRLEPRPSEVVISVEDTGSGIPPDVLPRIFEPAFTTKPPGRGSGLGLATVRDIVLEHGGRVAVSTEPGAGTRFDVVLPRVL